MKKIFIAALFAVSSLFISCSNEDSVKTDVENKFVAKNNPNNSDVSDFLDSYYNTSYDFANNISTADENNKKITITEVVVNDDMRARGYVVTDNATGEFLYFADVDRTNYVLSTYEASTNEYDSVLNIDQTELYSANQYDFIEIIEAANASTTKGGWFFFAKVKVILDNFWETTHDASGVTMGADSNGNAECTKTITTTRVRFWINWGSTTQTVTVKPCPQ